MQAALKKLQTFKLPSLRVMCKTKTPLFVVRTVVYVILFAHVFSTSVTVGIKDILGLAVGQHVFC